MHTHIIYFYIKKAIVNYPNIELDWVRKIWFAASRGGYYKEHTERSISASLTTRTESGSKRKQRRAFNDIVTGIPSGDQKWFLQAVADGNQRRMLDVGCRAFGWVVLFWTICHSGKPTTPFASLAPSRVTVFFSHSPPSWVFIAANRRNMPTRSLRHPP